MRLTNSKRFLTACAALFAVVATAPFAQAAVIVQSEGLMTVAPVTADVGTGGFSIDYTVQSDDTEVLVIGAYIDNSNASASDAVANVVEFNGIPADHAISSQRSLLAYWSQVPAAGTAYPLAGQTNAGAGRVIGYYVWELSNVDLSLGVDEMIHNPGGVASTTGAITTSSPARLVTNFYGANKQDDNNVVNAAGSIVTNGTALLLAGANTGVIAGGSGFAATSPGPHALGWTATGGSSSTAELAFAFAMPVPEPSSLMLLVGGVLMLAGRRRWLSL